MLLTDEMKEMVERLRLCYVATVSQAEYVSQRIAQHMGR